MVISVLVIAALVEISAIFWGAKFLERELRRHSEKAEERHAELMGKADVFAAGLNELKRDLAGMEAQRKKEEYWRFRNIAALNKTISTICDFTSATREAISKLIDIVKEPQSYEDSKQIFAALQRMEKNMDILREAASRTADNMQDMSRILAAMQDVAADFDERLEKLRRETPEPLPSDEEAKQSRSMEEGITNLLQYQVGKERES